MKNNKRIQIIKMLYNKYLNRDPEEACINTYYSLTQTKESIKELINIIHNSDEYKEKQQNTKSVLLITSNDQTTYHLHNNYHLGDSVFNLIFFNIIRRYLETKNITIYYYCKDCYIYQLKEFVHSDNIKLKSISSNPVSSVELWVNNRLFGLNHDLVPKPLDYNTFYVKFFNIVLEKLQFKATIKRFEYRSNDLLTIYEDLPDKYKNIQILILNSQPLSGQFEYNKVIWDNYIKVLNQYFNICTTTKVSNVQNMKNITCTFDNRLTIKKIAALSTNVPIIIAINSGVLPGLLNKYTLNNVKRCYTFDNRCYYTYPNFVSKAKITDITLHELQSVFNNN